MKESTTFLSGEMSVGKRRSCGKQKSVHRAVLTGGLCVHLKETLLQLVLGCKVSAAAPVAEVNSI